MKKMLRFGGVVLSALMVLSSMVGCVGTGKETAKDPLEGEEAQYNYTGAGPVTDTKDAKVSILALNSWYSTVDYANAEIIKNIESRAGVSIDWTLVSPTNYEDSVRPMLASGSDLPDIVELPDFDENMNYINAGLFYALDEYMDYMPNYKKFLDKNPTIKASLTADNGHIYYVPQTAVTDNYQPCIIMNIQWLDQLGLSVPKTLDEFVEVLRAFRDHDMNGNGDATDEIPLSIEAEKIPYMFGPAFGLDLVDGFYADKDGTVHFSAAEKDKYKNYLTFLNKLYAEGLLEVEYTSLTRDQITERCAKNMTGVTFDFSWQMSQLYSKQYPDYTGEKGIMAGIPPLSGEEEGYYLSRNPISKIFGVSTADKNPLLAIKFLDYAMGEESQDSYVWGIEGESYTISPDGKKEYTKKASDNNWLQQLGINAGCLPSQQSVEATDVLLPNWHVEIDKELMAYSRAPWPFIYSTTEEQNVISQYLVDITTYVEEMNVAFITGTTDLDSFDSYLSTLNNMGLQDLLKVRQDQYKRFLKSNQ